MHATTFGATPAAGVLAELLDRLADPRAARKVSRLLQDFNAGLDHIAAIPDPAYRARLALLWRDDFLARVRVDAAVDKFVRNVITARAKPLLTAPDRPAA